MEGRLVLKDCCLWGPQGQLLTAQAVAIEGERVCQVGEDGTLPLLPGDWGVSCRGRLVMRGKVNGHVHLLKSQWQMLGSAAQEKFESLLGANEVEVFAAHRMAQALLNGFCLVAEHLRCPEQVGNGLAAEARVARRLGLRVVLSHQTDSRSAVTSPFDQLSQNAAFLDATTQDAWVFPALGLGEAKDCDDALWEAALREQRNRQALLTLCSRSKLGRRSTQRMLAPPAPESSRVLYSHGAPFSDESSFEVPGGDDWTGCDPSWVSSPARLREVLWGDASQGIQAGALADLVIHDFVMSPVDELNAHTWFQLQRSKVAWTIVNGRVAVREGTLLGADELELAREAAQARALLLRRLGGGVR